ncbi:MAG: hypothetical protein ABJK37_07355 [Paraglaciecola sp.]|uniref:hypothetical protein n=1 Tax=Paraglaciecola sp. TaxID=1920173 RepID=UPI0032992DD9
MFDYISNLWDLALQGDRQGIWFWASVYTFLVCGYSALFQSLIRTWPSTIGHLINLGVDRFGSDISVSEQDYKAYALYSYQIAGKTFQGKRISPWIIVASHNAQFLLRKQLSKVETFADNGVRVFYKPSNPAKSWLILPSKFGITMTIVISMLPALSYWLEFYG